MTSDERREVAERLRDDDHCYSTEYDFLLRALGIQREGRGPCDWAKVHRSLADLIDPMCHAIEKGHPDEHHVCYGCSVCGYGWHEDVYDEPYAYCPHCGARVTRVVTDNDQ